MTNAIGEFGLETDLASGGHFNAGLSLKFGLLSYLNFQPHNLILLLSEIKIHKTGVINDPLGQPTVPAGSDCRLILKFWDVRTDGRTYGLTDTLVGLVDQLGRILACASK